MLQIVSNVYMQFTISIYKLFFNLSVLLASWCLFSTKVEVGNQLTLLFHFFVTHYGLNMQLQCIYMEICSERKTNRRDGSWLLAE